MIRSLRKAHAGAALAIAALAIAGCSAHPGAAAFVNGKEITEKQVDRIAAAIDETGSEVPGRAQIVILKMRLVLAKPVLDRASGVLTEDLKSKMRSACSAQYRFVDPAGSRLQDLDDFCYLPLLPQADPQSARALSSAFADARVKLNPRYGELKQQQGKWRTTLPPYLEIPENAAS